MNDPVISTHVCTEIVSIELKHLKDIMNDLFTLFEVFNEIQTTIFKTEFQPNDIIRRYNHMAFSPIHFMHIQGFLTNQLTSLIVCIVNCY
jgi:hypothetical protein